MVEIVILDKVLEMVIMVEMLIMVEMVIMVE